MNTTEIIESFEPIIQSSEQELKNIAQDAINATKQFQTNQLSESEYKEIIADLKTEQLINVIASNLNKKEELNSLLSKIITIGTKLIRI